MRPLSESMAYKFDSPPENPLKKREASKKRQCPIIEHDSQCISPVIAVYSENAI